MSRVKKRKPLIAFLLTILRPGIGQIYNQQPKKGIFFLLYYNCFLLLLLLLSYRSFIAFVVVLSFTIFLWLFCSIDAVLVAKKKKEVELLWYNRWYFYVGLGALVAFFNSFDAQYLRENYAEAFRIPSYSMIPTVVPGDHIMVLKEVFENASVKRGDIVIFTREDDPQTEDKDESHIKIIKRIIALPGERVSVKGKEVFINGVVLDEPYVTYSDGGVVDFEEQEVSANSVFLLGDNRDHSFDSRHYDSPFIPLSHLKGKVAYIYFSTSDFTRMGLTF